MEETRVQVIVRTVLLLLIGLVILVVLTGYTIAVFTEPDPCAQAVGGQCIP